MAGTGFHSIVAKHAPIPQFVTIGITPWQSALKFRLLTVAILGTFLRCNPHMIFFFKAIRGLNTVARCTMVRDIHLCAVCHNRVKSSTSHFTPKAPLFAAPRIFLCATLQV
jgi:hypothetical protein